MNSKLLGREGEAIAADYLRKQGYRILASGYHSRYGEIDLIAQKDEVVAFVEVKLRKNGSIVRAFQAVNRSKQEKIMLTAEIWVAENNCRAQYSFDIIEVYTENGTVNHIKNAFV